MTTYVIIVTTATTGGGVFFQVGVPFSTQNAKWTAFRKVYSENKNTEYTKEYTKYANQNTKYAKQNTKYAKQNTNYAKENTKYAKQNTKSAKQNTKYAKQNTKYAISIKRLRQKTNMSKIDITCNVWICIPKYWFTLKVRRIYVMSGQFRTLAMFICHICLFVKCKGFP